MNAHEMFLQQALNLVRLHLTESINNIWKYKLLVETFRGHPQVNFYILFLLF